MDEERREFFRVMVRLPVACMTIGDGGRTARLVVRSVDLSAGGVKIVTEHALDLGARVRLAFAVADGTRFKLDGAVTRAELLADGHHRYALAFDPLDRSTEQRMFRAVFDQEQANADRHRHVRMDVWEPVEYVLDGETAPAAAHAVRLSADDVEIIGLRPLRAGDRVRLRIEDAGLGFALDAAAVVTTSRRDFRRSHVSTLAFDDLDRLTRAAILRRAIETERRERAGD